MMWDVCFASATMYVCMYDNVVLTYVCGEEEEMRMSSRRGCRSFFTGGN